MIFICSQHSYMFSAFLYVLGILICFGAKTDRHCKTNASLFFLLVNWTKSTFAVSLSRLLSSRSDCYCSLAEGNRRVFFNLHHLLHAISQHRTETNLVSAVLHLCHAISDHFKHFLYSFFFFSCYVFEFEPPQTSGIFLFICNFFFLNFLCINMWICTM